MNPSYRHDKEHNYMILEAIKKLGGHEYQIRMLLLNDIPGVLKCNMRMLDGNPAFYYEITSKQPMSRIFEKHLIGKNDIQQLLIGIERALEGAKKYLLDVNHFLLNPEYIYMDVESGQVSLCCLPFYEGEIASEFHQLAEYVLKRLDHNDDEAVLWGYEIYSRTVNENYSLDQVLQSVYQKMGQNEEKDENVQQAEPVILEETKYIEKTKGIEKTEGIEKIKCTDKDTNEDHKKRKPKKRFEKKIFLKMLCILLGSTAAGALVWAAACLGELNLTQIGGIIFLLLGLLVYFTSIWSGFKKTNKKRSEPKDKSMIYEYREISETEVEKEEKKEKKEKEEEEEEEGYGVTTILHTGLAKDSAVLISMNPDISENLVFYKGSQVLGKLKSQVDISLNLSEISRIHAKIDRKEDGWYLTDLNSRNGTFVNGERLEGEECRKIKALDTIHFASYGYYFK